MPIFAVIKNNIIENVIVAETVEIAEQATGFTCIELPEEGFGRGDSWDGTKFIAASVPEIIDVEEVTPTPALEG